MKDFYVQLMSNASTKEFAANSANSVKNRLPNPLQFREPGWKVGLASITYPIPPSNHYLIKPTPFNRTISSVGSDGA